MPTQYNIVCLSTYSKDRIPYRTDGEMDEYSGFYPPKSGIKIGRNFPPVLGWGSPQFLTQVLPSILGFFPL